METNFDKPLEQELSTKTEDLNSYVVSSLRANSILKAVKSGNVVTLTMKFGNGPFTEDQVLTDALPEKYRPPFDVYVAASCLNESMTVVVRTSGIIQTYIVRGTALQANGNLYTSATYAV